MTLSGVIWRPIQNPVKEEIKQIWGDAYFILVEVCLKNYLWARKNRVWMSSNELQVHQDFL